MITSEQLYQIMDATLASSKARCDEALPHLIAAMTKYEINTPKRMAAFLAQLGHESGSLRYTKELASGQAYEGRKDLGNISPGDGVKYKGRGLIQLTGFANYTKLSLEIDQNFTAKPELLEQYPYAALSAAVFWTWINGNALADSGDFDRLTKKINGGYNGKEDRDKRYTRAKKVLGC